MQKKIKIPQQKNLNSKVSPTHLAAQNQLTKGYALHQQGDLAGARNAYLESIKLNPQNFEALQLMGTLCAQSRQSAEALHYFNQALAVNDTNSSVFNNRGIVLMELKQPALALESYERAISLKHDYPEAHSNKGNALQALNQIVSANASYIWAIVLRPGFADTYNNQGVVLNRMGAFESAIKSFQRAIQINPGYAQAYYNCARAIKETGNSNLALAYYNKAIELNTAYIDAYNNRGNLLLEMGDFDGALESFNSGLKVNSSAPQLHNNKGTVFKELKRFHEAIDCYKSAIQIYPQYADALNNLGNVLQELKQFSDALHCYDQALSYNNQFVDAYNNKGVVLRELKQNSRAVESYRQALLLNPQFAQSYFNLGNTYKELDQQDLAQLNYKRALAVDPNYQSAKWAIALLNIPSFIQSAQHLQSSRIEFKKALAVLDLECEELDFLNAHQSVGLHQPFYLAYQERNNRELMQDYAQICHKVMHHWEVTQLKITAPLAHHNDPPKTGQKQRFKLGIISDQIRYHSVWNAITKGIVQHLNLDQFEIHIFYLGTIADEQTAFAKSRAASFTQNLPSLKDWAQTVLSKELDAILYPEIGMHALTLQLAHLRLAPLQMVSWGHPETTGVQTIDYYLSAQLFEDSESQNAYSEKLLALPSLGCTYEELQVKAEHTDLSAYGLRPQGTKLLCPGTLFKYSPEYDWTFAEIAQELLNTKYSQTVLPGDKALPQPSYQFLFFYRDLASCELFKARLKASFQSKGLNVDDWVVFLPWMSPHSFYGLMKNADLFLDSLGFSGFNTAMQAVECALPIVTMQGRFLRGRFASAILTKLDTKECIAHSDKEYVQKVVELANDPTLRAHIKAKMSANRQTLFNDLAPVRALEQFLLNHSNPPL